MSPLYATVAAVLTQRLPNTSMSHVTNLALVTAAAVQTVSCQLGKLARAFPLNTSQAMKEQRLRRLLDNDRLTQTDYYHPLVKHALTGLKGQRVHVLIDRVLLHDHHNILVVSIGFRRRSIPLGWMALSHRGASGLEDQKTLLAQALTLLPAGVRVTVHGDSEFRTIALFDWLRTQGHNVMLGVTGGT